MCPSNTPLEEKPKVSKEKNQHGADPVPSITQKSSGLSPLLANMEPRQDSRVEKREPSSKPANEKA